MNVVLLHSKKFAELVSYKTGVRQQCINPTFNISLAPRLLATSVAPMHDLHWKLPRIVLMLCRYWPVVIIPISCSCSGLSEAGVCAHSTGRTIRYAGIAIANPVVGDIVSMTNHHWSFSIRDLQQTLQLDTLKVVNDFTALAMALPHLSEDEKVQIGGGTAQPGKVIGLIGRYRAWCFRHYSFGTALDSAGERRWSCYLFTG
jgi:hypothetical protein